MLEHALEALRQGWWVFPVEPNEKTPIRVYQDRSPEDAPWTIRWSEMATNDPARVHEWWAHAPRANIGIACKQSKLLVVDCDVPKSDGLLKDTPFADLHDKYGPRVHGLDAFEAMAARYCAGGEVRAFSDLDTRTHITGSGGIHFLYRWPDGVQASQASPIPGVIDTRGNGGERGGYILGPGSVTDKGPYYGASDMPVKDAPVWLVELCRDKPRPRPQKGPMRSPRSVAWGGLVATVRTAADGNLNNALFWASRAACQDGLDREECVNLLAPVYVELGGKGGERQAEQTIRSAYRRQGEKR